MTRGSRYAGLWPAISVYQAGMRTRTSAYRYKTAPSHSASIASNRRIMSSASSELIDSGGETQIGKPLASPGCLELP